jgi:hypothetical protein
MEGLERALSGAMKKSGQAATEIRADVDQPPRPLFALHAFVQKPRHEIIAGAKVVGQAVGESIHPDLSAAGRDTVQHRT